jgi:primosomal protein N' (replication factor Y)
MEGFLVVGMRVVVPFGKKLTTGIIAAIHNKPPEGYTAKYLDTPLDDYPVVSKEQLKLWDWMADYYMCHPGEILLAALPVGLRLSSESRYIINPAFDGDLAQWSEREQALIETIAAREVMSPDEVAEFLGIKTVQPVLKNLLDAGVLFVMEDLKERFKPKIETYVKLSPGCEDEEGLKSAFDRLERAPKQLEVLMVYVRLSGRYDNAQEEVKRSILQKHTGCSPGTVKQIADKGIFELYEREVGRLPQLSRDENARLELSPVQERCLESVQAALIQKDVTLLQGITGSGKTEIYIRLIQQVLSNGSQALYLLPEIALTTQIITRLQRYFGNAVVVYHSRFNQNERVEIWNKVRTNNEGRGCIVLGARSALFLPFVNLSLVIVDEEHESSFKQFDPAPRYHARDSAIVLAKLFGAKTLLGSATPSIESLYNAESRKYGFVKLDERYGGIELPVIKPALLNKQTAPSGYFTQMLLDEMGRALQKKEQIILFQNRRGYAPVLVCESCAWSPECTRCDVSTTYHKSAERLVCHYCGNKYNLPPSCPACGSHKLKLAGFGTERIEEELPVFFPDAKIARLDYDTTRSKHAYAEIINDFQDRSIDILIGTQMVTKGLDFDGVSTVGILNADLLLKYPDFRAAERGFQLITQVAGRAGRRQKRGIVLVQTREPESWLIQKVIENDYQALYKREIEERIKYGYPPFVRLVLLTFQHREAEMVDFCAAEFARRIESIFPKKCILGPEYPNVARIKNRYHKQLMLKIPPELPLMRTKQSLSAFAAVFFAEKAFKQVRLVVNVDPQ